jgi:hypothetical protein
MLNKFRKMVDAVDSFLNNAVDLYVQAVDYCRISTSQIPTPVGVGIQQIKSESSNVWQMSPDSGDIMPERLDLRLSRRITGHLAGVLDGSGRFVPGIRRKWPDSNNFCWNLYMPN